MQLGKNPSDYAGTYKIGAYYDSSQATNLATGHETDTGGSGLYLEAAQQIFKTGPGLRNGLAIFGIYTVSDQNTAKFKDYFEAGAAYRGLVPGRELDILSLGWVRTNINCGSISVGDGRKARPDLRAASRTQLRDAANPVADLPAGRSI